MFFPVCVLVGLAQWVQFSQSSFGAISSRASFSPCTVHMPHHMRTMLPSRSRSATEASINQTTRHHSSRPSHRSNSKLQTGCAYCTVHACSNTFLRSQVFFSSYVAWSQFFWLYTETDNRMLSIRTQGSQVGRLASSPDLNSIRLVSRQLHTKAPKAEA